MIKNSRIVGSSDAVAFDDIDIVVVVENHSFVESSINNSW